jgi:hypothetical protein
VRFYQRSPATQSFRRPALSAASVQRARHFGVDSTPFRRPELEPVYVPRARNHFDGNRVRFEPGWRAAPRKDALERRVLQVSTALLVIGAAGCLWLLYNEFGLSTAVPPTQVILQAPASKTYAPAVIVSSGKGDSLAASTHLRVDPPAVQGKNAAAASDRNARASGRPSGAAVDDGGSPATVVARSWGVFESEPVRTKDKGRDRIKETNSKPQTRVAALESPPPQIATRPRPAPAPAPEGALLPRITPEGEPKTILADFETAPFPYDGRLPGSGRSFLNAGEAGHRSHTNFRGRVFSESDTYGDDRVLLHIPPGFDANKPGVMIVFFHGHGAILARDVRDRQQVPAQITASGVNAVLVAPQFAVNAADSSAGKFWQPGGFKRFVDEAAVQLARLDGDPKSEQVFANMPIVLVAYSGGFGPTLSVLDRGGVKSRLRGLVLLDALYSGTEKFADWIASNRSAFFVSSYTPHTRGRNAELEHLLSERSVSYSSELRRSHMSGSVTFLPAGDISHRDFVNRAWAESPIKDILVRLDDFDPRLEATATIGPASGARAAGAAP